MAIVQRPLRTGLLSASAALAASVRRAAMTPFASLAITGIALGALGVAAINAIEPESTGGELETASAAVTEPAVLSADPVRSGDLKLKASQPAPRNPKTSVASTTEPTEPAPSAEPAPRPFATIPPTVSPHAAAVVSAAGPAPAPGRKAGTVKAPATVLPACIEDLRKVSEFILIPFEPYSTNLEERDLRGLRLVAEMAANCDGAVVAVEGHSDATGDDYTNMRLSWERAEAAIAALEAEDFDISAFRPIGFGSRYPYAEGSDGADSAALNRRVQITITYAPRTDDADKAEDTE